MILSTHKEIKLVWDQYDLKAINNIKRLSGGLINETFCVVTKDYSKYIVQRLSKVFTEDLMNDFETISEYLTKQGWNCPRLVHSKGGASHVLIQSEIWRVYKYIEEKDFSPEFLSRETYFDIGKLLGLLHSDLYELNYSPSHILEGFHDKDFYVNKALKIEKSLYPESLQDIIESVIENLQKYSENIKDFQQIIHGDPRIENILFSSKKKPCTFIDYDTFMSASIYVDIGDCLRSLMLLDDKTTFLERINQFINGYQQGNVQLDLGYMEALKALKYVTMELTLRFIIDSVEQSYFSWDSKNYETSAKHNEVRVLQHWNLFNKLDKEL